jgi:hypothetical protein
LALIILAGLPAALPGAPLRFEAPTFDNPGYAIRLTLDVHSRPFMLKEIRLNGTPFAAAFVFRDGKPVDKSKPLDQGTFEVKLDYAWASGKKYTVSVLHHGDNPAGTKADDYPGLSPASGGVPEGCAEGFCRVYKVREEAGLGRRNEICRLTLTALRSEVELPEFRLYDGPTEIPYQVLARAESPLPPAAASGPAMVTYKLAFPLDSGPRETKLLRVFKGRAGKLPSGGLSLSGENLGKTLRSASLVLQFQPQSGQILTIEYPREGIKLWNKAGVIHWNPDVFIPGVAWDHSFDWNPPQVFEEKAGGLVYLNSRRGPLPRIKDVILEVRYEVAADRPYFIAETLMTAENDLGVIAVRNDEMVLYKELFDTLIYKDVDGRSVSLPLREKPGAPHGLVHVAPPDVPWVGLVNSKEGFGFFSLRLEAAASNLAPAGDFGHKAGTYFYAPSDGDYVYWVRPLLYTWGEYSTNSLLTFLPKGSFFYEKNAYVLFRMNDRTPRELDALLDMLRNPLRIF